VATAFAGHERYASNPDNTIVVSPHNASRRRINPAARSELQDLGAVAAKDHAIRVLAPRSDMTEADRTWAARYAVIDALHYPRGSQDIGIEKQSYTKVIATQPKDNLLAVRKEDGTTVTYNPARLLNHGSSESLTIRIGESAGTAIEPSRACHVYRSPTDEKGSRAKCV